MQPFQLDTLTAQISNEVVMSCFMTNLKSIKLNIEGEVNLKDLFII